MTNEPTTQSEPGSVARGERNAKGKIIANQQNEKNEEKNNSALTAKPVATAATFAETLAVYSAFAFQGKHD